MDYQKEIVAELEAAAGRAVNPVRKQVDDLADRVQEIEQKGVSGAFGTKAGGFDLGRHVVESEQFRALKGGMSKSASIEIKTAIINATGASQPLVQADRMAGIVHGAERRLTIRDLLATARTSSNAVEFAKENVYTNSAGPTVSGSPEQYENIIKPESGITFTLTSVPVVTLAHWIPVSRQVMDDSEALRNYIGGRLLYGLRLKEEDQLLNGTGSNHQLTGLLTNATALTQTSPQTTNSIDLIRMAIAQVEAADFVPNAIILNPVDWKNINLRKVGTGDVRYVVGDPLGTDAQRLWGIPVVVTNSIAAGTFLVADLNMACMLWDRWDARVEIGYSGDGFVKNTLSVLAEERLALTIFRSTALVKGTF